MSQPSRMDDLYAPPAAHVDDIVVDGQYEHADRLVRLAATIIDGVMFTVLVFIGAIGVIVPLAVGGDFAGSETVMIVAGIGIGIALIVMVAINLVYLHRNGQTIGKRLLNIKVVRTDGSRATLSRIILLRWLPITLLGSIPYIGYVVSIVDSLLIFRDSHQCLHDTFADTIVIKA